ncbi:MAG: shikimate kinase AroK [Candidatus Endonucleobacter bathymodioli]|uniref:Shikimate kinase n=1 Tax=Candidatus Endonucleibacter bathymodioli TaxID=539814 RepID=A0AA90NZR3_9GAMM|nr:shikimate kinase AroK [Candidatus Endonucleobacter bathymodioli]
MLLKNIYLIGPMGAGKTTVGRVLANELNMPFLDSDQEVEMRSGADITWIFDVEGEEGFRQREGQVIAELCSMRGVVVATGGGVIKRRENRMHLSANGFVVYLYAPVSVQLKRTLKDKKRPLLQRPDRVQVLETLMAERDTLYRGIADLILDTDVLSSKMVATKIIRAVTSAGGGV